MLRRHCQVSAVDANERMPWWERRLLVEGMQVEFSEGEEVTGGN